MAVSNSPGWSTVWPGPRKNWAAGTSRSPPGPNRTNSASSTSVAGEVSAQGEALHRLPPRVARLRIWYEATVSAASASSG